MKWKSSQPLGRVKANRESESEKKQRYPTPCTVNLYRTILGQVFTHAIQVWDYIDSNPVLKVKRLKEYPREPVILSKSDIERLLDEVEDNPLLHLFTLTAYETGARSQSEVLTLRWEDLEWTGGGWVNIKSEEGKRTKSGKSRSVPMSPRLAQALKEHEMQYRLAIGSKWVFCHLVPRVSKKGEVRTHRGDRIERMYWGFKAACLRAGLLPDVRPHDLRHTRITHLLADGHSVVKVKEMMGHADIATTMKYTHLVREDLRELVEPQEQRMVASL